MALAPERPVAVLGGEREPVPVEAGEGFLSSPTALRETITERRGRIAGSASRLRELVDKDQPNVDRKILKVASCLLNGQKLGAALGSRTPDLRITRDVITGYTVLTPSIGTRQSVHRAQRRRL